MPLDQALGAVADQADDARATKLFAAVRAEVVAGEPLAGALARWPRTFSRPLPQPGRRRRRDRPAAEVLVRLADYLEARLALRQQFTLALIYPALVTVIAIAVIAVLLVFVVPQVVSVYQQSRQTLPWLTRALIATSGVLPRHRRGYWLAGACVVAVARSRFANRRAAFRAALARARCCACPVAGRLVDRDRHRALREHARDPGRQRHAAAALAGRGARRRLGAAAAPRGATTRRRWCAKACRSRAR